MQTSDISKQVKILDKAIFDDKVRRSNIKEKAGSMSKSMDIKRGSIATEKQNKDSLENMITTAKRDILALNNQILQIRQSNAVLEEKLFKEQLKEAKINDIYNKIHEDKDRLTMEIAKEEQENEIASNYYSEVIRQKRQFINLEFLLKQRRTKQEEKWNCK